MYYIGIDGGGTKSIGVLSDGEKILSEVTLTSSNPKDIGLTRSADLIVSLIRERLPENTNEDVSVFAGIAGAGSCSDELCALLLFSVFPMLLFDVSFLLPRASVWHMNLMTARTIQYVRNFDKHRH